AAPLTPVGAEASLQQKLVRHRRRPRRLLHALSIATEIRSVLRRGRRTARRVRRTCCAADDLVVARVSASGIGTEHACALTRPLLIPEHAELVPGRRLRRETQ